MSRIDMSYSDLSKVSLIARRCHLPLLRQLLVSAGVGTLACCSALTETRGENQGDRLVPVEPSFEQGDLAEYKTLYERKLFVTRGDVARFLYLPSGISTERTAAIYRVLGKESSLLGNYWVTATEASGKLLPCIPILGQKERPVNPRTIKVRRDDAPLPASTAQVIRELWLAMLVRSRPPPEETIKVDSTILIFSATGPGGSLLRAQADSVKGNTADLWGIGESLIGYCRVPASERVEVARKIEKAANKLLRRVRPGNK